MMNALSNSLILINHQHKHVGYAVALLFLVMSAVSAEEDTHHHRKSRKSRPESKLV